MSSETKRKPLELVPGIRYIDEDHAAYAAGLKFEYSRDESTILENESSFFDDTLRTREWKKQGMSMKQIFLKKREIKKKQIEENEKRLDAMKEGAKDVEELTNILNARSKKLSCINQPTTSSSKENFAIPSLPSNRQPLSPSTSNLTNGTLLACSTPKQANLSLAELKMWNVSQVVNTDELQANKRNVIAAQITINVNESSSELQKTVVINKDSQAKDQKQNDFKVPSLQSTFVVEPNNRTFTIHEKSSENLQKTFTVDREEAETQGGNRVEHPEESLRNTFVVNQENETKNESIEQRTIINKKKTTLEEREKRNTTMSNELLMNSFITNTPSPGAKLFNTKNRKKLRMSVATPPRAQTKGSRLSTESDKEKTIDMLSINDMTELDSNAISVSYVSAVSENMSRNDQYSREITPIVEENDYTCHLKEAVTQTSDASKSFEQIHKKQSDFGQVSVGVATSFSNDQKTSESLEVLNIPTSNKKKTITNSQLTPTRNYEKPTIASINRSNKAKSLNSKVDNHVSINKNISSLTNSDEKQCNTIQILNLPEIEQSMSEMNVVDNFESCEVRDFRKDDTSGILSNKEEKGDGDNHNQVLEESTTQSGITCFSEISERIEGDDPSDSFGRNKNIKVALLSDSLATVNTPKRNSRVSSTNQPLFSTDHSNSSESDDEKDKKKQKGLLLAKRKIIKPNEDANGLRRSRRNRCKPLRSWLGEQAIYVNSPSGGERLKGVTDVIVTDKRYCKYLTADPKLATERQNEERAMKKARAEARRKELARQHKRNENLNISQEDIVTSEDEE